MNPVKVFWIKSVESVAKPIFNMIVKHFNALKVAVEVVQGDCQTTRFSNNNLQLKVDNVRGHYVVVIHTQTPNVNEDLIELFLLLDAIRNANPSDILLVFPYLPYCRSDIKNKPRISVGGKMIPNIISGSLGIKNVLLLDPHAAQIKHYFNPDADEISATFLIVHHLKKHLLKEARQHYTLVFPDAGASKRFERVAPLLNIPSAFMVKSRPDDNEQPMVVDKVVGNVENRDCLIFDDEILTGNTLLSNLKVLKKSGARSVSLCAIHPICEHPPQNGKAQKDVIGVLEQSSLKTIYCCDTVPIVHKLAHTTKFKIISVSSLLGLAIAKKIRGESISDMYKLENVKLYYS